MADKLFAREVNLTDNSGRVRARLYISAEGKPVVDALDATGRLLARTDLSTGATKAAPAADFAPRHKENIFEYGERIEREVRAAEPRTTIGAHKLFHDFQINETEASARYINEVLIVTGELAEVQLREYGDIFAGLKGISSYSSDVVCHFSEHARNDAANLRPGQRVRIKGKCTEFTNNKVKLWGCLVVG